MKKNIRLILAAALALILVATVGVYGALKLFSGDKAPEKDEGTQSSQAEESTSSDTTAAPVQTSESTAAVSTTTSDNNSGSQSSSYEYAYAGFAPKVTKIDEDKWYLTLINRDYILPDNYTVKTVKTVVDIYGGYDHGLLDYRVAPHYIEMYNAALEDGLTLSPLSGYRSVSHQRRNFENRISLYMNQGYSKKQATIMASEIILPPQTSEHNAGLCMDILSIYESFENTKEYAWLCEHAADYGFILRYPKDKQNITKITFEPWHWRYVGVEDAKKMKASNQCLEEYLGLA